MKQAAFTLLIVLALPASARAFDIAAYCRNVSDAVGGSYQIELTCRQQEEAAQSRLSRMHLPDRVRKYCTQVAQAVGGSYEIMVMCVQQELEAKSQLQ